MTNEVQPMGRRQFLIRLGGATAVITVVGAGLGFLLRDAEEAAGPSTSAAALTTTPSGGSELEPAPGTRPEYPPLADHYRVDINFSPPVVDVDRWRLRIHGLVETPVEWTLDELRSRYEPLDQYITLSCISNPVGGDLIGTTRWTGVSLKQVLADVGVKPGVRQLLIRSVDGFHESVDLDVVIGDERVMLAYAMDGQPLPIKHGAPLRLYIPDRYGMKQPKWIEEIEAIDRVHDGYWVARAWDREALVRTTSVIDTVAVNSTYEREGRTMVPIGGIAYAGAKGISKVEVRVGRQGEWVEAALLPPLSDTTWVLWRYDWPFEAGRQLIFVRAYDGSGELQIEESNPPAPSGATGLHWVREDL